jgi:ubiquinone/menaquinone biosynthesis C-methylase UbiE
MVKDYLQKRETSRLFGDLAPLVPKVEQMFEGPQTLEAFKANGEEFLTIYRNVCGLRPDEKMLDVGCGIGRKTLPLTRYFNDRAVYEGIDITKAGINWCKEKITQMFPNFRFQWIDVYNKHYNPQGEYGPADYKFPFASQSFGFVMLGSVFTHMLPDEVANYLSEVCRVLTTRGRCLITYFLLNEESSKHIEGGQSTLAFTHMFDRYRTVSRDVPELAVSFNEDWIKELYSQTELKITRIDYGSWCGRSRFLSYQDMILAVKV